MKYIESFAKSSYPAMYPDIASSRFMTSPQVAMSAMCHSVTCVNLYIPCLLATLSAFALMSNSRIPSQRKYPFVNRATSRGSHTIGIGALKCMSCLSPNCCHVQNFVFTDVSKWNPTIFFTIMFAGIMIKKEIRA